MATELTGAVQSAPQNTPPAPSPVANIGVAGNLNKTPDNVVTHTAKADKPDFQSDDAHQKQARNASRLNAQANNIPRLEELSTTGVKTVVGFDVDESNHIYIRVQDSNTGQEIAQIPSKEFVQYLRQRFEELSGSHAVQAGVSASI